MNNIFKGKHRHESWHITELQTHERNLPICHASSLTPSFHAIYLADFPLGGHALSHWEDFFLFNKT